MIELDKIYNEDCLEGMKRIADGAVDCIITDLPYGTLAGNNEFTQWDEVIPFEPLWAQFHRVMKSNGVSVLFGQEPFSTRLRMSNFKEYKYDIIWVKNQAANFANCRRQPMKYHENISVFYTKGATYNLPNLHKISPINSGRANKGGTSLSISRRNQDLMKVSCILQTQAVLIHFTPPRSPLTSCATLS